MVLSVDIANRSIQLIGDNQPPITGSGNYPNPTFDTSPAGVACAQLYVDAVNTMAREHGYDAFRSQGIPLVLIAAPPPYPWAFVYQYPADCIELLQIIPGSILPAPGNLAPVWALDNNDPKPTRWNVANLMTSPGVKAKVILSDDAGALATYSSMPNENLWDAGFTHVVVRFLASELAMAIAGRPETSQGQLAATGQFSGTAQSRPD